MNKGADIMFVCHGKKHEYSNPGYKYLNRNMMSSDRAVFIDYSPKYDPTYAIDVTDNHMDMFEKQFDHIFIMFAPDWVLTSKQFWFNVYGWLKPGGIVQTVLPKNIYRNTRDYMVGFKIAQKTGMRLLNNRDYMTVRHGIVLMKEITY